MAPGRVTTAPQPNTITATWSGLAGSENGDSATISRWADRTVQAVGTFTSITMQGSNDGANWFILNDPQGVDIVLTAPGGATISENPIYIRPVSVGAAGCTVIVTGTQS